MVASLGRFHRRRVVPAPSGAPMSEPSLSVLMAHNEYQTGSPSGKGASVPILANTRKCVSLRKYVSGKVQ